MNLFRHNSWDPVYPGKQPGFASDVVITDEGKVTWIPEMHLEANCDLDELDLENRWEEQGCHMKFGSWVYNGNKLVLNLGHIDTSIYSSTCPMEVRTMAYE